MALELTPNQPVATQFNPKYGSGHEYELLQRVRNTDIQKVQVKCTPHTTPADYSGSGWTVAGGISHSGSTLIASGAGTASKTVVVTAAKRYAFSFTVNFTGIDSWSGYRVKLNSQYLKLPDAGGGDYSILSGVITTYLTVGAFTPPAVLEFETTGAGTQLTIERITIAQLSEVGVQLLDEAKSTASIPVGAVTVTDVADSPLTNVTVNWGLMAVTGLYYLRFYDVLNFNVQLLTNGNFDTDLGGWEAEDGGSLEWTNIGAKADYDGTGTTHGNTLSQLLTVPGGSVYGLTFAASNIAPSETLQVYYYVNGVQSAITNFIAGPYALTIDLSSYTGLVELRIVFKPGGPTQTMKVDTVELKRTADISNTTHIYSIQAEHPFTLSFYAANVSVAYGFNYAAFYMQLRCKAELFFKDYPEKSTQYTFSDQSTDIVQGNSQKHYEVFVYGAPEYIHDALRLMRLSDVFRIDGKDYVSDGVYKLEFTEGSYLPAARFLVKEKKGISVNNYAQGSNVVSLEVL